MRAVSSLRCHLPVVLVAAGQSQLAVQSTSCPRPQRHSCEAHDQWDTLHRTHGKSNNGMHDGKQGTLCPGWATVCLCMSQAWVGQACLAWLSTAQHPMPRQMHVCCRQHSSSAASYQLPVHCALSIQPAHTLLIICLLHLHPELLEVCHKLLHPAPVGFGPIWCIRDGFRLWQQHTGPTAAAAGPLSL